MCGGTGATPLDERRVADEQFRLQLGQRLAAIEVSQKLFHDELKSILEMQHREIQDMKTEQNTLRWTLFGGPKQDDVGLLERFRALLWKAGIGTTCAIGFIGFMLKLFGPTINKMAQKLVGTDDLAQYQVQQSKKKIQVWNSTTRRYEYYIEFTPIGNQGQRGAR